VGASLALRSYATANVNRRRVATALLEDIYVLDEFWNEDWAVTGRDPDEIRDAALLEVEADTAGPNTVELAALASYHLTTFGSLGTQEPGAGHIRDPLTGLERPRDKREPKAVFGAMLATPHGVNALHRAIVDGRNGVPPRQINEDGSIALTVNNDPVGPMTNFSMRTVFRESAGTPATQTSEPASPRQQLATAVRSLKAAVSEVTDAIAGVEDVQDPTGMPLVDVEGVDEALVNDLRGKLEDARESLAAYKRTWLRRHPRPTEAEPTDHDLEVE
jgi:hypothetical protein